MTTPATTVRDALAAAMTSAFEARGWPSPNTNSLPQIADALLASEPLASLLAVAEAVEALRALSEAATPGPWTRTTEGHASELDVLMAVGHSLRRGGEIRWTDATYILHGDGSPGTIAFVGNGPRQTDNGELIAAAVNALREALSRLASPSPETGGPEG